MTSFRTVRTQASPTTDPHGIGGSASKIWYSESKGNKVHEVSVTDFSIIMSEDSPYLSPKDIGGDANVIWYAVSNYIYELSTTDLSVVRSGGEPTAYPYGIGGNSSKIWYTDYQGNRIHELSTSDFSSVRNAASPADRPRGIGGDSSHIWHVDERTGVYELSTSNFSVIRSRSTPGSNFHKGCGGDASVVWETDFTDSGVYEFDPFPNEVSYYFNSRSTGNWTDPDKMIDDILANFAYASAQPIETLNGNSCGGGTGGPVGHIYFRVYGYSSDGDDRIDCVPVYGGITDGAELQSTPGLTGGWTPYMCIANDAQEPTWDWNKVKNLDVKVEKDNVGKAGTMYCAKVEMLVTYSGALPTPPPPPTRLPCHGFVLFQCPGIV